MWSMSFTLNRCALQLNMLEIARVNGLQLRSRPGTPTDFSPHWLRPAQSPATGVMLRCKRAELV